MIIKHIWTYKQHRKYSNIWHIISKSWQRTIEIARKLRRKRKLINKYCGTVLDYYPHIYGMFQSILYHAVMSTRSTST